MIPCITFDPFWSEVSPQFERAFINEARRAELFPIPPETKRTVTQEVLDVIGTYCAI